MSLSKFTKADFDVIEKEWDILREMARKRCANEKEFETVCRGFDFANQAHMNVRRRSGAPYMIHPIQVAEIVISEIGLGYKSITAALLHDVVEDTDYTVDDIKAHFGEKIASLVDGLTKIKNVLDKEDCDDAPQSLQADNFKRILLTLNDDARVVLIKLADRLHNCRTIEFMPEHKRDKILSETMYIFIPLAHRLGLYSVKSEMENIWLKFKEPDAYAQIKAQVEKKSQSWEIAVENFIKPIDELLKAEGHSFEIKKRIKTPYSIWRKMQTKHIPFDQIYDLYAVRIIYDPKSKDEVQERQEAHQIYSAICTKYNENPSRFRNWISSPKPNGYEALHCTLMSHDGLWVEVQIRSRRMDDIAEKGIAAHWTYKREGYVSHSDGETERWLASIQEILMSKDLNNLDLLDFIHNDLTSSEISVFTPKGEQRSIMSGATVLDFAYSIHTHIGQKAAAAKVNMKLVPLSHVLKSGDQVEIITIDSSNPKREWLTFLKTRRARTKVIDYFRSQRDSIVEEGKALFKATVKRLEGVSENDVLRLLTAYFQIKDVNEIYFRLALRLVPDDVLSKLTQDLLAKRHFSVEGNQYVFANCCNPIPGDALIGIRDDEGLIHIHKKSCPIFEQYSSKHGDSLVSVQWPQLKRDFPVKISFRGLDRLGMLNEISHYISLSMGVNMRKIEMGADHGVFDGKVELLVKDKRTLDNLIDGLKKIDGMQDVARTDL